MLVSILLLHFFIMLHDGEHAGFGAKIVERLKAVLSSVILVAPLWNEYEGIVHHETLLFKISKASAETREISATDTKRDGLFKEVRHRLRFYLNSPDPVIRAAADALLFLLKPYEDAAERSLFEETTFIRNFLTDINKPAYAQYVAAIPGLVELLAQLAEANDHLDVLYTQRLEALEELKGLGKRLDIRKDADHKFIALLEAINSHHHYLELSNAEPETRAKLEEAATFINALVDQLRKVLAQRGRHSHKADQEPPSEGTQTPDKPEPPAEGPQNPDTTLPAAPDVPNQNPSTDVPVINPDDLNPPAAGE